MPARLKHLDTHSDCSSAPSSTIENQDTNTMTDETDEWTVIVKDSNGTLLSEGDAVVLIKDLKVKGANTTIKRGATYKNIRLTSNAEEVEVRDGKGTFVLKTCFLKKA
jgi:protein PhnA